MTTNYIHSKARSIMRRCGSRDPFEISSALGVEIISCNDLRHLKGMYKVFARNRFAFLNANLRREAQRVVLAHELGHDALHRELAKTGALKEFMLYDMSTRPEYEANVFAGELLLDDDEVFSLVRAGYDLPGIASELCTDYNLLLIKMNEMVKKGFDLRVSVAIDHRFLAKNAEYEYEQEEGC
ncbi:ImmA/IrrE family metallo-endopeptidase [Clostridia bacterium]|nr:ImmA/IrrE family metallo-endopeptidase [Clostridia bacterium]